MINDELFIKGFNSGYIIAKYEPELSQKIAGLEVQNDDFVNGIRLGQSEYAMEKAKKKLKAKKKDANKERGRGRHK